MQAQTWSQGNIKNVRLRVLGDQGDRWPSLQENHVALGQHALGRKVAWGVVVYTAAPLV